MPTHGGRALREESRIEARKDCTQNAGSRPGAWTVEAGSSAPPRSAGAGGLSLAHPSKGANSSAPGLSHTENEAES